MKISRIYFLRACFCVLFFRACFRRRFGVHFSWFSTYFSPIFHEKPSIPYIILQSAKITTWLLFRLAPASCDFASCFAMSSKGEFSGFRGAKTCFYLGFSTFASRKHEKSRILRRFPENLFPTPFWPPKRTPFFCFWHLFLSPGREKTRKYGNLRAQCRDKFRKVRFSPISLLPGSILEPPGTISEPPGLDFGGSGP